VLICSHDCDIENGNARAGILIAPVVPLPKKTAENPDALALLRNSWKRTASDDFEYPQFFPLIFDEDNPASEFALADFSRMMTACPMGKSKPMLLALKTREMTDEHRELLQWKLAAFVGRGPRRRSEGESQST
jgi:hypothetical protein